MAPEKKPRGRGDAPADPVNPHKDAIDRYADRQERTGEATPHPTDVQIGPRGRKRRVFRKPPPA